MGLYSFDFMLKQIDKTRDKLKQKEGYLMEEFLFGFQIWIMEAIPAFGDICGTKVSDNFSFVVIVEDVQNVLMKISLALRLYFHKRYAFFF